MADDADRAQDHIEASLEWQIAVARGPQRQARETCCDCAEDLDTHRVRYGICVECQTARERQQTMRRIRVF